MAHIRQKFKDGNLDGYQKKKYLAKVVFTYILGYKVDVGHMEAVNLISSQKYSEKQIVSTVFLVRTERTLDGYSELPGVLDKQCANCRNRDTWQSRC